jgi:hypothetical protein
MFLIAIYYGRQMSGENILKGEIYGKKTGLYILILYAFGLQIRMDRE